MTPNLSYSTFRALILLTEERWRAPPTRVK